MDSWEKFVAYFCGMTTMISLDVPGTGKADVLPAVTLRTRHGS